MADSPLKQQLTEAMKDAMRAKDKFRLGAVRLALAEIKRIEVDERIELDDERVTAILDKMVKQRRESIKQFEAAERRRVRGHHQSRHRRKWRCQHAGHGQGDGPGSPSGRRSRRHGRSEC